MEPSHYHLLKHRILNEPFRSPEDEVRYSTSLLDWGQCKSASAPQYVPLIRRELEGRSFEVVRMDVAQLPVGAILNAANETLLGGGGIDECVHRAAGYLLLRECASLSPIQPGQAVATKGYDLQAAYVIHTVAPLYCEEPEPLSVLRTCYRASLQLCEELRVTSFGLSPVGCGFYGFPVAEGSRIAVEEAVAWQGNVKTFVFAVHTQAEAAAYVSAIEGVE